MDSSPKHSTLLKASTNDSNVILKSNSKKTEVPGETTASSSDPNNNSPSDLPKLLEFGRELFEMNTQFTLEHGENPVNTKMIRDAFSLLAYKDPHTSPIGYQLESAQREPISALLNSVILEANNMPRIPSLEVIYGQTNECIKLMSKYGIAWCAYVNLADYMQS